MGKNQHSKDRMFVTATEWATLYGGKKRSNPTEAAKYKRLPFDCCSISMQPAEHPMCTKDGHVFDIMNIVPFIRKFGVHPVTGEKIEIKDLVKLHIHKNHDGKYHDPVSYKVFTPSTHIVAIATTGNVYSYETVSSFNIKAKNWFDLITETPFKHADIITLQDPSKPEKNNFADFYHVKKGLKLKDKSSSSTASTAASTVRLTNTDTKSILEKVEKSDVLLKNQQYLSMNTGPKDAPKDKDHTAHFSTGEMSASFTSTHMNIRTTNTAASLDKDLVRHKKITEKGYVRMRTNYGDLNIELHCDITPITCENFLLHSHSGYYKNTVFHRNIRNFMIQGGDPTGTGRGGRSAYEDGKAFKDEFDRRLRHDERGILSMANSGKDTNKSQFFITYRACKELDKNHSVFGRVVGGLDVLMSMERVPVDKNDRPTKDIKIFDIQVFKDPFKDQVQAEEQAKVDEEKRKEEEAAKKERELKVHRSGVGMYVPKGAAKTKTTTTTTSSTSSTTLPLPSIGKVATNSGKRSSSSSSTSTTTSTSKTITSSKKAKHSSSGKGGFGDFSSW